MSLTDISMLFEFIGGLGMFLYGMNLMADGLQKSAGGKVKNLLGYLTNNRLLAILVGTIITAIIQSSSATTVMVVGFVNAGILNLTQAVGVIMGANIGTTITSWLVSMNEWGAALKPEFFAPLIVGVGAGLLMFAKKSSKRKAGEIFVGFGLLFIGLSFMSGAITPYRDAPIFSNAFTVLGRNPILGIIAGMVVTATIQSSSASVGILQTLAANGIVSWNSAIYITLGQNIGTCVTALISSAGANKTAKRAAVIHLLFNTFGAVFFGIVMFIFFFFNKEFATSSINSVQISIFHTIFNITCTVLMFPFANALVRLSGKIIKEDEAIEDEEETKLQLDKRMLETPSLAIEAAIMEIVNMGKIATENAQRAIKAVLEKNSDDIEIVFDTERTINLYEKKLTEYLVLINDASLTDEQHFLIKNLLYTVSDLERVGDHAENIAELAQVMVRDEIVFSTTAEEDLKEISSEVLNAITCAVEARESGNVEFIRKVLKYEDAVDTLEEEMRDRHIQRLSNRQCKAETGVIFLDIIGNLERISDHAINVAGYVKDEL